MSRVFIITGSRKGIGRQLAEYYLSKGDIVAGCSRGKSSIKNSNYMHFELDISDEDMVINMVRAVKKQHGHIDILLNNAGIASMNHILTTPYTSARKIFNTNFFGTFLFTREVSKIMIKQKNGRIVNYSTVAVALKIAGESIYSASKAAIENFTRISAKELSAFGIRVNAVAPTPLLTDLIKGIQKDKIDELISQQAIHRLAEFDDISNVVDFFINEKSDFITGQVIYLGGV